MGKRSPGRASPGDAPGPAAKRRKVEVTEKAIDAFESLAVLYKDDAGYLASQPRGLKTAFLKKKGVSVEDICELEDDEVDERVLEFLDDEAPPEKATNAGGPEVVAGGGGQASEASVGNSGNGAGGAKGSFAGAADSDRNGSGKDDFGGDIDDFDDPMVGMADEKVVLGGSSKGAAASSKWGAPAAASSSKAGTKKDEVQGPLLEFRMLNGRTKILQTLVSNSGPEVVCIPVDDSSSKKDEFQITDFCSLKAHLADCDRANVLDSSNAAPGEGTKVLTVPVNPPSNSADDRTCLCHLTSSAHFQATLLTAEKLTVAQASAELSAQAACAVCLGLCSAVRSDIVARAAGDAVTAAAGARPEDATIVRGECGHAFHVSCIRESLLRSAVSFNCPQCRATWKFKNLPNGQAPAGAAAASPSLLPELHVVVAKTGATKTVRPSAGMTAADVKKACGAASSTQVVRLHLQSGSRVCQPLYDDDEVAPKKPKPQNVSLLDEAAAEDPSDDENGIGAGRGGAGKLETFTYAICGSQSAHAKGTSLDFEVTCLGTGPMERQWGSTLPSWKKSSVKVKWGSTLEDLVEAIATKIRATTEDMKNIVPEQLRLRSVDEEPVLVRGNVPLHMVSRNRRTKLTLDIQTESKTEVDFFGVEHRLRVDCLRDLVSLASGFPSGDVEEDPDLMLEEEGRIVVYCATRPAYLGGVGLDHFRTSCRLTRSTFAYADAWAAGMMADGIGGASSGDRCRSRSWFARGTVL